jgi:hypothetical protein
MHVQKSRSGHGRGQRKYWEQLRILDIWLFPHLPAVAYYADSDDLLSPGLLLPKRFLDKISVNLETRCHVWTAGLDKTGYGQFYYDGNSKLAHGYGYRQMKGPVPEGKRLDHLACKLHYCVYWEHLEPVSPHENNLRAGEDQVDLGIRPSFQSPLWRPDATSDSSNPTPE